MEPAVIAAVVTGGFALVVALYNALTSYRRERKLRELGFTYDTMLESRKSELSREETAAKARADYEYSARLSLYKRFEPRLFQLMDLADYALDRIKNLTDPSVWTKFVLTEAPRPGIGRPPMAQADYELTSTLYGLFAPLVLVRSMSRQLTLVDLSLERRIELPYYLASRIYGSFKDDAKLAAMHPPLTYTPFHPAWRERRQQDPATYWWQGLTMGRLENILDLLSTSGPESGEVRLLSFGEFERLYERVFDEGEEWQRKALAVASNPLVFFKPETRPVYWRLLVVQACLYNSLLRTPAGIRPPTSEDDWMEYLSLGDHGDFGWKEQGHTPTFEETLEAAKEYLRRYVVAPRMASRQRSIGDS
jgi:hypothetical protein